MRPRKLVIKSNAPFSPSAAASPESCDSAFARLPPVNPKRLKKFGVSVPPALKKLLSALATLLLVAVQSAAGAQTRREVQHRVVGAVLQARDEVRPAD